MIEQSNKEKDKVRDGGMKKGDSWELGDKTKEWETRSQKIGKRNGNRDCRRQDGEGRRKDGGRKENRVE